jgi:hypothetical protein
MFPIAPHFITISFALSSTLVTYIKQSKGGDYNICIWDCSKLDYYFFLWWANQGRQHKIEKIELWGLPTNGGQFSKHRVNTSQFWFQFYIPYLNLDLHLNT